MNKNNIQENKTEKLKILYILDKFPQLSQTFIFNEIIEIIEQNIDVNIISIKRSDLDNKNNPKLCEIVKNRTTYLKEHQTSKEKLSEIKTIIKIQKPNHIHTHFIDEISSKFAYLISKETKIPYTITTHAKDIFREPIDIKLIKRLANNSKKIITISEYNKKYLIEKIGINIDKIKVLRCGININEFKQIKTLNYSKLRIITIARLVEKKGIKYLIEACILLKNAKIDFECIIIGDGPEKEKINKLITIYGLKQKVLLLGAKNSTQINYYLNNSNIFILPCIELPNGDKDGVPVSLMEAMSKQIPVISTKISGIPELIDNNINGILCNQKNSEEIYDGIIKLKNNPNFAKKLGINSRIKIETEFNEEKNVAKLSDLFESFNNNVVDHIKLNQLSKKPKILLLADFKGWAYDIKAKNIVKELSYKYEFDIKYTSEEPIINPESYDGIYIFYWRNERLIEKWNLPKNKLSSGITCSLKYYELEDRKTKINKEDIIKVLSKYKLFTANSIISINEFKKYKNDVIYTPNGVDTELFKPLPKINDNKLFTIGWVGNKSIKTKHFEDIIIPTYRALNNVRLLVATKEQKIPHNKLPLFYNQCDCLIVASEMDGTPNPALEAGACGVPIISNRIGNMPELIKNEKNGFLVDLEIKQYVDKINYLKNNPELKKQMNIEIRTEILKNWSWKKLAKNYDLVFQKLVDKNE